MSYAPLADLKAAIRITDTDSDALLQMALDAADEAIDDHCNRTFVAASSTSARSFVPTNGRVDVDDMYTLDGLILTVGGTVIPAAVPNVSAGYVLEPPNALAYGEPITGIRYASVSAYSWPFMRFAEQATAYVTAKWGYAATVPTVVKQACLLQASRIFSRRLSPYGIAGSPDMGSEIRLLARLDADVAVLLAGKVRYR